MPSLAGTNGRKVCPSMATSSTASCAPAGASESVVIQDPSPMASSCKGVGVICSVGPPASPTGTNGVTGRLSSSEPASGGSSVRTTAGPALVKVTNGNGSARASRRVTVRCVYKKDAASRQRRGTSQAGVCGLALVCVTTETRPLDRLGQLGGFEQDSNTDSHSARNKAQTTEHVQCR